MKEGGHLERGKTALSAQHWVFKEKNEMLVLSASRPMATNGVCTHLRAKPAVAAGPSIRFTGPFCACWLVLCSQTTKSGVHGGKLSRVPRPWGALDAPESMPRHIHRAAMREYKHKKHDFLNTL